MEEADRLVAARRKLISDLEQDLSSKQRESHNARMALSSDRTATKSRLESELAEVDTRLNGMRDRAAKLQSPESGLDPSQLQDEMAKLKQEAQKFKQRKVELQKELQNASADPAALE